MACPKVAELQARHASSQEIDDAVLPLYRQAVKHLDPSPLLTQAYIYLGLHAAKMLPDFVMPDPNAPEHAEQYLMLASEFDSSARPILAKVLLAIMHRDPAVKWDPADWDESGAAVRDPRFQEIVSTQRIPHLLFRGGGEEGGRCSLARRAQPGWTSPDGPPG